jgi:hypothetical protein
VRSQECGTNRVCRPLSEHLSFLRACVHSFVLFNSGSSKGLSNPSFGASIAFDRLACRLEMSMGLGLTDLHVGLLFQGE